MWTLVSTIIKTISTKLLEQLTQRFSAELMTEDSSFKQNRCLIVQLIHAVRHSVEHCFGRDSWTLNKWKQLLNDAVVLEKLAVDL